MARQSEWFFIMYHGICCPPQDKAEPLFAFRIIDVSRYFLEQGYDRGGDNYICAYGMTFRFTSERCWHSVIYERRLHLADAGNEMFLLSEGPRLMKVLGERFFPQLAQFLGLHKPVAA